jgi:hypothetical protein
MTLKTNKENRMTTEKGLITLSEKEIIERRCKEAAKIDKQMRNIKR